MQNAASEPTEGCTSAQGSLRAKRPRLAGLIIGAVAFLGLVALVLHIGDIGAFADAILRTDPGWLLLAILAQALAFLAQAIVWGLVLSRRGSPIATTDLFVLSIGKLFADQAIPSAGVSGAVFFIHALIRRGVAAADAFAAFVFGATSFILTFVAFAAGSLVFLAFSGGSLEEFSADLSDIHFVAIALVLLTLVIGAFVIATQNRIGGSHSPLVRIRDTVTKAAAVIRKERGLFLTCIVLQAIQRFLDGATLWIAFEAQGGGVTFATTVIAVSLGSLAATVAPTPMGLGSFEAGLLAALASLGHGVETSFAAGLIYRGLSLGLPLALGFIVVQRELLRK